MDISEVTRRNIFDELCLAKLRWSGRLADEEFLGRLYDLKKMPSHDGRYRDAASDIFQHRTRNNDWDDDWVLSDTRFNLLWCADEALLRFLCEVIHPVVQPDSERVARFLEIFNRHLAADGWEIFERTAISGQPVFSARPLLSGAPSAIQAAQSVATTLNAAYVSQQVTRLEGALKGDPELAIGTAKEFVETICKTILGERNAAFDSAMDFPQIVRATLKELSLAADQVDASASAADTIRRLLQNLATISNGLAELRNPYGTGHGKHANANGLGLRHARLAVGAASALGVFLFETHQEKSTS